MFFGKKAFSHARNIIKNSNIIKNTPLELNERLSRKYNANIYVKREDLQTVRSFKVRGAYYKYLRIILMIKIYQLLLVLREIMLKAWQLHVIHLN